MNNKVFIMIILSLVLSMCSSPKIMVEDYYSKTPESSTKEFLNKLNATEGNYSVLFFTDGFLENQNIKVKNGDNVIFNEILETDRVLGFANAIRVNNNLDIIITNTNTDYSFKLPRRKNIKYKYIYVSKVVEEDKNYTITYSNAIKGFM